MDYPLTIDFQGATPEDNAKFVDYTFSEVVRGPVGAKIPILVNLDAQPGFSIGATRNGNLPTGLEEGIHTNTGTGTSIPFTVTIGDGTGGSVLYDIATAEEMYQLSLNWDTQIAGATAQPPSATFGFGGDDLGTTSGVQTVTLCPTEASQEFTTTNHPAFPAMTGVAQVGAAMIVDGCVRFNYTVQYPSDAGDASFSGAFADGDTSTKSATSAGTNIRSLTPGIPSSGGTATFEVTADGAWNANISILGLGGQGGDSDSGTYSVTSTNPNQAGTSITSSGSYSPTTGGLGTTLISLQMGQEPIYLNPAGNTGLSAWYYGDNQGPQATIHIYSRRTDGTDGILLSSATVTQAGVYGGREVTVPSTWTTSEFLSGSTSSQKPNWTFYTT